MPNTYKVRDFKFKMPGGKIGRYLLVTSVLFAAAWCFSSGHDEKIPVFGKDTVLVWEIPLEGFSTDFVVRLACYSPDLLMEWEDDRSQGTVFIPRQEIMNAKGSHPMAAFEKNWVGKNGDTIGQKIFFWRFFSLWD